MIAGTSNVDAISKLTLKLEKFRLNLSSFDLRNWPMHPRDSVPLKCNIANFYHYFEKRKQNMFV